MSDRSLDLKRFVDDYRASLPAGFDEEVLLLESDLAEGRKLATWQPRGAENEIDHVTINNVSLRNAILRELSLFLCSDHPRYADVRGRGKELTSISVSMIAGYLAATIGLSLGVATAAVGFIALAISRVSLGVFCQLCDPLDKDLHPE